LFEKLINFGTQICSKWGINKGRKKPDKRDEVRAGE